jgi:hypothetical protein
MVDRVATYLVEVYGADEALEFATRAVAENRARDRPASVAEWERVVMVLRDPERVAEIVRDLERVSNPPEHAAWCVGKNRLLLALASAFTVDLPL